MGVKKVVLITTGQPSSNPRIVKEADAFYAAGFEVMVLYCFWIRWALDADKQLLKNVLWNYKLVGGNPSKNKLQYLFTKARQKILRLLNKSAGNNYKLAERVQARCYDELLNAAKRIKADWYIGHNLGTLAIACNTARFNRAKCGFDFEDYHREESNNMQPSDTAKVVYLEEKYIPHLDYISTASHLTTEKIRNNFPDFSRPIITLMNCFPVSLQPVFKTKTEDDRTLKLFWFSQTVGKNRGIEIVIQAMRELNDDSIHLTLAGMCNKDFEIYLKSFDALKNNIHFAGIIQPGLLLEFSSNYDIGLALETGFSINNSIALSNKIFTYLLAGNAIIISKTKMQKEFNDKYKIGEAFEIDDCEELIKKILFYKNRHNLTQQRLHNYELAKRRMNWEMESKKLLDVILL